MELSKFAKGSVDASLVIVLSVLYALIEIELEAGCGWGVNIPTSQVMKSSHFTWYHMYMRLFLAVMCIGIWWFRYYELPWWKKVLIAGFFLTFILLLEDFFWFVLNPYFGLKKYNKDNIPWHTNWLGPTPIHNIYGLAILLVLAFFIGLHEIWYSFLVIIPVVVLIIMSAPLYHSFYKGTHNFNPNLKCAKIPGL